MGTAIIISAIVGLLGTLATTWYTTSEQKKQHQQDIDVQQELQEDAQAFSLQQMAVQQKYNLENWNLQNEYNLPVLQYERFRNAGISENAAAQAVLGSSSGFNPIQGISTPSPSISQMPLFSSAQNNIGQWLGQFGDLMSKFNDTRKTNQDITYSRQMIDQSKEQIRYIGQQIDASKAQMDIAERICQSQIGLNQSQVNLNLENMNLAVEKINESCAQQGYLDSAAAAKVAEESLFKAQEQTESSKQSYYQATSTEAYSQANYNNTVAQPMADKLTNEAGKFSAEDRGQQIENYSDLLKVTAQQARFELSKALKIDIDSPLITQIEMAAFQGDWETVNKLVTAGIGANSSSGFSLPSMLVGGASSARNARKGWKFNRNRNQGESTSFTPDWNPPKPLMVN